MLLDRDPGLYRAVATSISAVIANPVPMAVWGLIVAGGLLLGSLPVLLGLIVVMPVLGHATWHLYRKTVEPGSAARVGFRPPPQGRHHVADFPVALFTRD